MIRRRLQLDVGNLHTYSVSPDGLNNAEKNFTLTLMQKYHFLSHFACLKPTNSETKI